MDEIEESFKRINVADSHAEDPEAESEAIAFLGHHEQSQQDVFNIPRTPQKTRRGSKHALTPESKLAAELKPKRFAQEPVSNLSREQCNERRSMLCEQIRNVVVVQEDDFKPFIKQADFLNLLNRDESNKSLLSRVKACFPNSMKHKNHENEIIYTNLSLASMSAPKSTIAKELFASTNKEISEVHDQIAELEPCLVSEWERIGEAIDASEINEVKMATLRYQSYFERYVALTTRLVNLYEKEIEILKTTQLEHLIHVSTSQRKEIIEEVKKMEHLCSIGLRMDGDIDGVVNDKIFQRLLQNVEEKCPLIYSILQTLLVSDARKRVHKSPDYKMKCGVNALALLLSVHNQTFSNDVRLVFGLLCITYGAGKQFVNMLHKIGLTPHWDTVINFLDHRLEQLKATIKERCVDSSPVILLMDNINMYRGRKRHDRLFQELGPRMWNFTGCAAIIPDLSDIEDLISCEETTTQPQIDIASLKADHILLESMPEHKMIWEKWCDRYFLNLLDKSLNCIPDSPKQIDEMNETEIHAWLQKINFQEATVHAHERVKFRVKLPPVEDFCKSMQSISQTDVINLPLSLEDNSTLTGTASILEEFANEFRIPCDKPNGYIEYDATKKQFELKAARERYSFMKSVQMHHTEMVEFEKVITSMEKEIVQTDMPSADLESESDDSDVDGSFQENTTRISTNDDKDNKFNAFLKTLIVQAQETVNSSDDSYLDKMVQELSEGGKKINDCKDRYGRTIFHAAVEDKQYTLVKILLASGINPNAQEGCGATPMSIAVINSDFEMCKLLQMNFGAYQGELFGSFPTPQEMAIAMELNEIINLFDSFTKYLYSPIATLIQSDSCTALPTNEIDGDDDMRSNVNSNSDGFVYKRSECKEIQTAVVGDVGTCKNNRSVNNRDGNAYGWCAEIPGDMHAKGYLCEATFKAMGSGGFHKVVNSVMKRPRLTKEASKKRKFQDQNLNRIKESVRDGSQSYGMAAVKEFYSSTYFPSAHDLKKSLTKCGNHNEILLERFKKWLRESAEVDESHQYHQQLFTLFAPLLELFLSAGKQGDGHLRETVWVIMLPIFAQLNFRNYWTESFVHVVNFTGLWPLAFRGMIKRNSNVNLTGKSGHNVDLDEYVETYIVRPLKTYVSGHTSVQMCKRLMGNLNLFSSARSAYSNKDAFDNHVKTKHKEQTPFPDQIKGMWFCIRSDFFKVTSGNVPYQCPLKSDSSLQKRVLKTYMQVKENGERKVREKFEEKLHDCFPAFRKFSLRRVLATENDISE